jgi:alcohol-forming fatty acyl-CoA reductase
MAERTLKKKRRPDLPMVILRPSIIIGSYNEPYQGWTDTFSAAGGLSLGGGSGLIRFIPGDENVVSDLIPVDYVANTIIVTTAIEAGQPKMTVVHCGTSHLNPTTWGFYMSRGVNYLNH